MANTERNQDAGHAIVVPEGVSRGEVISWREVSGIHKGRHGIYQKNGELRSLLTDLGKISKCYPDIESDDGSTLFYTGSGRRGDQKPDVRNRALIEAVRTGVAVPLFCKLAVNRWKYLGLWRVADSEYVFDQVTDRMVWRFVLKIIE
ncbi:MAG: hypothetical protein HKN33_04110 [Pyrinomonadaceae bacterium]|nr:hypothetical protein [Pyrinomonadaceae bacterium]